jgi:hypothetical protein
MNKYTEDWFTSFAKNEMSMNDELRIDEPTDNPIVNQIWKIALNQTDISYSAKLFYLCGFLD